MALLPTTYAATLGDVVKSEYSREQCRENAPILAGAKYLVGTVLAMRTSDGIMVPCQQTGTDGIATPVGILLDNVDATAANVPITYLNRGPATLSRSALIWHSTVATPTQRTAKLAILRGLGLIDRTTV